MEEILKNADTEPQESGQEADLDGATIPEDSVSVPVKFNKQIKNLSVKDAALYAGKGMKYDLISEDYDRLKQLAAKSDKSVCEFLSAVEEKMNQNRRAELIAEYGGSEAAADRVLSLENDGKKGSFDSFFEISDNFPEIKSIDELPDSVKESAALKGSRLLDEYLRYLLSEKRRRLNIKNHADAVNKASVGPVGRANAENYDPTGYEFIKGLWK